MEATFDITDVSKAGIHASVEGGRDLDADDAAAVRDYMLWGAGKVAFALDRLALAQKVDRLVITGGCVASSFWLSAIASVGGVVVEAVDFAEFTAYGAALHARAASGVEGTHSGFPEYMRTTVYQPEEVSRYQQWYQVYQKPLFERELACK